MAKIDFTKPTLPFERLERVEGWGMAVYGMGYVYRPSTIAELTAVFELGRETGRTITLRGSGRSYGDAGVPGENICLELTALNRILDWDRETGIVTAEPGVTIGQLWQYVIGHSWWPPVVSGTMHPTLGGALAANIHGKNNFKVGPIGDHVLDFELLTPRGEVLRCSRQENAGVFHAAIGGFGLLGCFTKIRLQMKQVHSGRVDVQPYAGKSLGDMMDIIDSRKEEADYLVGWIDCFARGSEVGRGIVHEARYLRPGEDAQATKSLGLKKQALPDTLFGVIPKSILWLGLRLFLFPLGMRLVNWAKYTAGRLWTKGYRQSHAGFAFLLDYVPNWKRAYRPGGLVQFQSFIPKARAEAVFRRQIDLQQAAGLVSYLGVLKRHRPDDFLLSHAVDGFSLALDFHVTAKNRERLWQLCRLMAEDVIVAGGRFYLAKDALLTKELFAKSLPEGDLAEFRALKNRLDPEHLLQGSLSSRLGLVSEPEAV